MVGILVIPEFGRLRQEYLEFQASPGTIEFNKGVSCATDLVEYLS